MMLFRRPTPDLLNPALAVRAMQQAGIDSPRPELLSFSNSPNDQMLDVREPLAYLNAGASALACISLCLQLAHVSSPNRILDLGCGHGRVMRWLRAAYPKAHLTAADVSESGSAFCAKTFGAEPIACPVDLTRFPPLDPFDVVWAGSVITHLDERAADDFLALLPRLLRTGGVAIFSAHGRESIRWIEDRHYSYTFGEPQEPMLHGYHANGYGFVAYRDTPRYGISLIHPRWLTARIFARGDLQLACYAEKAWDWHHDVIAVSKL